MIIAGGPILTLDGDGPRPEALVVAGGRVLAAGPYRQLNEAWGAGAKRLDLDGRAVIPGLTDSHLHLVGYGLVLDQVQLAGKDSLAEMVAAVAAAGEKLPSGDWLIGRGWDQSRFREGRYPTRHDLDAVCPDRPVVLARACGHCSVANSAALALASVTAATADPPGGLIERDPDTGEPTGVLHESAAGLVRAVVPPPAPATLKRALRRALELALSRGLVACHPDDVRSTGTFAAAWRLYQELLPELGGPRIRLDVADRALPELVAAGLRTGSGGPMLSVGAIKTFADGSLGARSAALTESYADGPGSGILVQERDEFMGLIERAHGHGMQVAIHAIGDLAVDWALDAIEAAQRSRPAEPGRRHRVIHVQITRPDQLPRFVALGAVAEIQPVFVATDQAWVEQRIGAARAQHSYCWATMLGAGVACAGGSDGPVEPLDPLFGIWAAVNRVAWHGPADDAWLPAERLPVEAALRLFAQGGAYAAGAECWRGTLGPGQAADFVVLDRGPTEVPPSELRDLRVEMTFIAGRQVYGR